MASRPHTGGSASALPFALLAQAVPMLTRHELADFVESLIDKLDALSSDPDLENATDLEDDFALSPNAVGYDTGPGCQASDTGEPHDEDCCLAGDDGCGPVARCGSVHWGSPWEDHDI